MRVERQLGEEEASRRLMQQHQQEIRNLIQEHRKHIDSLQTRDDPLGKYPPVLLLPLPHYVIMGSFEFKSMFREFCGV